MQMKQPRIYLLDYTYHQSQHLDKSDCAKLNLALKHQVPTATQASLAMDLYQHCNHKRGQKINSITVPCKNSELLVVNFLTYKMQLFHHQCPGLCRRECLMDALLVVAFWRWILDFGNQSVQSSPDFSFQLAKCDISSRLASGHI